jgi:WD40 repeat protein
MATTALDLEAHAEVTSLSVRSTRDGSAVPGFKSVTGRFVAAEFSRDGAQLVGADYESEGRLRIRRWDAASGEALGEEFIEGVSEKLGLLTSFTRFGEYYFMLQSSFFGEAGRRQISLRSVGGSPRRSLKFDFSENGPTALAYALLERARDIKVSAAGGLKLTLDSGAVLSLNPAQDGATITDDATGARLLLSVDSPVDILDVSDDGRFVAVRSGSGFALTGTDDLQVWETRTGMPLSEGMWHEGALSSVTFTQGGQTRLLTLTDGGVVRAWHVGGKERGVPSWMHGLGEALSGLELVGETEIRHIPQERYAVLRQTYLDALRRAAESDDVDARVVLKNWNP